MEAAALCWSSRSTIFFLYNSETSKGHAYNMQDGKVRTKRANE